MYIGQVAVGLLGDVKVTGYSIHRNAMEGATMARCAHTAPVQGYIIAAQDACSGFQWALRASRE